MKPVVLCYSKCTTCKKALAWLEEQGIAYEVRPIKEQNPSAEELKEWYGKSGLSLKRFFNTSGLVYKEMKLKTSYRICRRRNRFSCFPQMGCW